MPLRILVVIGGGPRCCRARQRALGRTDLLHGLAVVVVSRRRLRSGREADHTRDVAARVVGERHRVATVVDLPLHAQRHGVKHIARVEAAWRGNARRPHREGRIGEEGLRPHLWHCRLLLAGDQPGRRGQRCDTPVGVIRDLREHARVLRAEIGDDVGRDRRGRERIARLDDPAAVVPADVGRGCVDAGAEARDGPSDLHLLADLDVLKHHDVAGRVDRTAEHALWRLHEARIDGGGAAVRLAVQQGDRVVGDGIDQAAQASIDPRLLRGGRIERPDPQRVPARVLRGLREDRDRTVAVRRGEGAVIALRKQRRLARGVEPAELWFPLVLTALDVGDADARSRGQRDRAIIVLPQRIPARRTRHHETPAGRQTGLRRVRRAVNQRPADRPCERVERRPLIGVDELAGSLRDGEIAGGEDWLGPRALHVDCDRVRSVVVHGRIGRRHGVPRVRPALLDHAERNVGLRDPVGTDRDGPAPEDLRVLLGERRDLEARLADRAGDVPPHQRRRQRDRHRERPVELDIERHRRRSARAVGPVERRQPRGVVHLHRLSGDLRRVPEEAEHEHRDEQHSRRHANCRSVDSCGTAVHHERLSPRRAPTRTLGRCEPEHTQRVPVPPRGSQGSSPAHTC